MDMGAHARAAQAAELALALAPQVRDPALVARMHRQVARTMLAEGRYADADASLAKAAELYRQLQIRTELANCHWMRGYLYAQQNELALAEAELRKAQAMLSAKRAALYSSQVTVELADVLHRRGKSDEAAALLHDVLGDLSSERGAVHSAAAHRLGSSASSPRTPATRTRRRSTTYAPSVSWSARAPPVTSPTCAGCSATCCAARAGWRPRSTPTGRGWGTVRPLERPPWARRPRSLPCDEPGSARGAGGVFWPRKGAASHTSRSCGA